MDQFVFYENLSSKELKRRNIYISSKTQIGKNVALSYNISLIGECVIGDGCEIGCGSVLENVVIGKCVKIKSSQISNSKIGARTVVGPFSHVRENSFIGEDCRIGNFVEIKFSNIKNNTKIAHLTYVGDAVVGKNCNIGCGVVFCNYNGKLKQKCILEDNVFIGSNCNIIAPVKLETGAYVAAGSTINENVLENQFAIARAKQINKNNFSNPYTENKN